MPSPTKPHFVVDADFPTSKEVLSIPRRYRAQAVGLWTLAGAWSAANLSDGHVPTEVLVDLGGTPAIVDYLVAATLWEPADPDADPIPVRSRGRAATNGDGRASVGSRSGIGRASVGHRSGIQFRNWPKWQKTRAEWEAGRRANCARQERHRQRRSGQLSLDVSREDNALHEPSTDAVRKLVDDDRNALRDAEERRGEKELSRELSAVGSDTGPPPPNYPDHCNRHRHDPTPPPCNDCRRIRELNHADEHATAAAEAARRKAIAEARRNCRRCEGTGFVAVDDNDPDPWAPTMRCPEHP